MYQIRSRQFRAAAVLLVLVILCAVFREGAKESPSLRALCLMTSGGFESAEADGVGNAATGSPLTVPVASGTTASQQLAILVAGSMAADSPLTVPVASGTTADQQLAILAAGSLAADSPLAIPSAVGTTAGSPLTILTKAGGAAMPIDCVKEAAGLCLQQLLVCGAGNSARAKTTFLRIAFLIFALFFILKTADFQTFWRAETARVSGGLLCIIDFIHAHDGLKG